MIDYSKFRMSLKRLEEQYENYRHPDSIDLRTDQRGRRRVGYSALRDLLRLTVEGPEGVLGTEELGVPDVRSPSQIPCSEARMRMNSSHGPLEDWLEYTDRRNDTSHDYSIEKAEACLASAPDFIEDAIGLHQTITGETWG